MSPTGIRAAGRELDALLQALRAAVTTTQSGDAFDRVLRDTADKLVVLGGYPAHRVGASLIREAQEFALAYEIVGPEYQQQFAKDAVVMIRKLASALAAAK